MDSLAEKVKQAVFSYASPGLNIGTYALANGDQGIYAVNVVDWPERYRPAGVVVLALIEGNQVIIEEDATDRPLVEALMNAGIPRARIVLRYAEETPANTKGQ
jgi:XisI protein